MTENLQHDINRYTVAVEKTSAWIGAQEAAQGVAGMAADDFRYPSNLVRAQDRLAELETILDGLLKRVVDEYVPSPPAWSTGPAGRWVLQLENAGWRAPEIADALMLVRSDIEGVVETLQQNRHFGIAQEPEDAAMTRRVHFERRPDPAGDRLEAVTLRDTSIGFVPAEHVPTILEALAAPKCVRAFIWKTPSLHGHFWLLLRIEGSGKRSFLGVQLEGKWAFKYPRTGADVLAEEKAAEVETPIAAPVSVEPFAAHLDLGRTLGAGIHIRRLDGFWQVRHDCSYGNGGYSRSFEGEFPTQRKAFDHSVREIRRAARFPIDADEKARVGHCIGDKDLQRANKILGWLNALVPPGPDLREGAEPDLFGAAA